MPALMLILGYAGLLPFVVLAGFVIALPESDNARLALDLYAFGIISFLCGAWWPVADMQQAAFWRILLSNVIFLAAFFAIVLVRDVWLPIAAALLVIILAIEQFSTILPTVSAHYRRMRTVLTAVASLSLLAAYVFGLNS